MSAWLKLLAQGLWYFDGYLVAMFIGMPFVCYVLKHFELEDKTKCSTGIKGAGQFIGILERILVVTFIYLNEPTAIGVIFTAKSIVRFNEAKQRPFAEYYLIGSMTSITFASIVAVLCSFVASIIG